MYVCMMYVRLKSSFEVKKGTEKEMDIMQLQIVSSKKAIPDQYEDLPPLAFRDQSN